MADEEQLKILKQGVDVWNRWRKENPTVDVDLTDADLYSADLCKANLKAADLTGAKLGKADLRQVNLGGANVKRANLIEANFDKASLSSADLGHADLSKANLSGAELYRSNLYKANLTGSWLFFTHLSGANLKETDLTSCTMGGTTLANVDLRNVKGLITVKHIFSSTVGVDTLYRSKGEIPEVFLRGAGLPDEMIEFVQKLRNNPVEFNSCFISYSTKDQEFAERLHADLQAKGVRCWFAPHDMKGGRKLYEQIDAAIHFHDRVLLILSPDSINSEWVKREIDKALKRQGQEKRDILFPIRLVKYEQLQSWEYLDTTTGKNIADEIRSYFIPDFSNWQDSDSYQKSFNRLLQDLKGDRSKATASS
jgi:hypothetical protein